MNKLVVACLLSLIFFGCHTGRHAGSKTVQLHENQTAFWQALVQLCSNTYEGMVVAAPANDTVFKNKKLLMHVRGCDDKRILIHLLLEMIFREHGCLQNRRMDWN